MRKINFSLVSMTAMALTFFETYLSNIISISLFPFLFVVAFITGIIGFLTATDKTGKALGLIGIIVGGNFVVQYLIIYSSFN